MATDDSAGGESTLSPEMRELIQKEDELLDRGRHGLSVFNNRAVHDLERERVFGDTWVFIGHESEVPDPGDYVRRYIAEDPFIFTRDEKGDLQVLFDSCRHRGTKLCRAEQGNTSHFRCPYHGWTYNNQGELNGVPEKHKAFKELDADEWGLEKPRFDSYNGLVFATMNEDAPSLREYLGDAAWYLDVNMNFPAEGMEVVGEPHRYTLDTDWKLGAENFAGDDYHIGITHQSALEGGLVSEIWGWGSDEYGGLAERAHVHFDDLPEMGHSAACGMLEDEYDAFYGYPEELKENFDSDGMTEEQYDVARRSAVNVGTIFPNFSFIQIGLGNGDVQGGFLSLRQWKPKGPGEMELWSWILVPAEASDEMKQQMYDVGMSTFTPAGTWEQDDFAVWDGIAEAAGSTFAKKRGLETNYEMGMDGMSETQIHEEWAGPGTTYDTHFQEGFARQFHRRWQREMTKKPL